MQTARQRLFGLGVWLSAIASACSVFLLTVRLAAYSDVSPRVGYSIGFALVVGCVLAVAACAPSDRRLSAAFTLVGLASLALAHRLGMNVSAATLLLASLLMAGSAIGAWVGTGIEQPGHLVFVAVLSSLADLFSVAHPDGPSALLAQRPEALALLALPWPMLGTREIVPFLGVGDVVFTSLYFTAARRHGLPLVRMVVAFALAFAVTALVVVLLERAVPVLPFLGAALLIAQPATRTPPLRDLRRGVLLITAFAAAIAVWVLRRSL
ncbi:MAG TPA: hypothetical protein VGI70_19820 [Polyangiales bacterium]|jgi:hypothetical protein